MTKRGRAQAPSTARCPPEQVGIHGWKGAPCLLWEQAHLCVPHDQRDREAGAQPASSCSERPGSTGASCSALSPAAGQEPRRPQHPRVPACGERAAAGQGCSGPAGGRGTERRWRSTPRGQREPTGTLSLSLTLSLFPLCASLPVGLLHTSFPTYFLVGLSGAFLGNPFYCKMNKRLQNNRRLHRLEGGMQSQPRCRPPAAPGPREVGRERRRGRKTLGQPCWAGGKGRPRAHRDGGAEPARLP